MYGLRTLGWAYGNSPILHVTRYGYQGRASELVRTFLSEYCLLFEEHSRWLCFFYRKSMFYPPRPRLLMQYHIPSYVRCFVAVQLLVVVRLCFHYNSIRDAAATPRCLLLLLQLYCYTTVAVALVVIVHPVHREKGVNTVCNR